MAIVLALTKLYDDVETLIEEESPGAVAFFFGWREAQKHKTAAKRIVFIPGDLSGDLGEIRAPRFPGANPYSSGPDFTLPDIGRPIANLGELFTVRIETYDVSNGENDRVQYQAVRELYDVWYRAVYLAAYGNFQIVSQEFDDEYNNRRHGAAIVVVAQILAVIPDNAELVLTPEDEETPAGDGVIATGYSDEQTELTVTDDDYPAIALVSPAEIESTSDPAEVGATLSWTFAEFDNAIFQQSFLFRNGSIVSLVEEDDTYTVIQDDVDNESTFFIRSVANGIGGPVISDSATITTAIPLHQQLLDILDAGAAQLLCVTSDNGGTELTGANIDSHTDFSGNERHLISVGADDAVYDSDLFGDRAGSVFAGNSKYETAAPVDLSSYDTLIVIAFARDSVDTLAVLVQRSSLLAASSGGFQFSLNNPGPWSNVFAGYKGGYSYIQSESYEAFDLDPGAVIAGIWDQTRTIWEVDISYNVANVSFAPPGGRIDTNTSGGFGSHTIRLGCGDDANPLFFRGDFACLLVAAYSGGATEDVIRQKLLCETVIKNHYEP